MSGVSFMLAGVRVTVPESVLVPVVGESQRRFVRMMLDTMPDEGVRYWWQNGLTDAQKAEVWAHAGWDVTPLADALEHLDMVRFGLELWITTVEGRR